MINSFQAHCLATNSIKDRTPLISKLQNNTALRLLTSDGLLLNILQPIIMSLCECK